MTTQKIKRASKYPPGATFPHKESDDLFSRNISEASNCPTPSYKETDASVSIFPYFGKNIFFLLFYFS
jgi:hypothetical protein